MLNQLKKELNKLKNKKQAENLQRFFKTKKGEYEEGDIFLGIKVPVQREIASKYQDMPLEQLQTLLSSKIHEYRMISLLILIKKFKNEKNKIFNFYLKNTKNINNWDLVDLSAGHIVGSYLLEKDKSILYKLAKSNNLWEKRIAIISTSCFIKNNNYEDTLNISKILLKDNHDLIHKAVGWMLREVGKKDINKEEEFLKKYYKEMPRTMLRYAIEKFGGDKRRFYLGK